MKKIYQLCCVVCVVLVGVLISVSGYSVETKGMASYEARGLEKSPSVEGEDFWLFIPRLLLTPPRYLLTGIFYPIIETSAQIEKQAVIEHLIDFFYNDARTAAILPSAALSNEYGNAAGVLVFHKDLLKFKERLQFEALYGGRDIQSYEVSFKGDQLAGSSIWIDSRFLYAIRASQRFAGIGNNGEENNSNKLDPRFSNRVTRYGVDSGEIMFKIGYGFGDKKPTFKIGPYFTYVNQKFYGERRTEHSDPSVGQVYNTKRLPGFDDDVQLFEVGGNFSFNLLDVDGQPSEGATLDIFAGKVPSQNGFEYQHYGFESEIYLNLYRQNRVLLLRTLLEAVEGDENEIPFSLIPTLGGVQELSSPKLGGMRLRGYKPNHFRDMRVGRVSLEYHYPIHEYLFGELFVDMGTIAKKYRNLGKKWHPGYGFGFLAGTKDKLKARIDASYGDEGSEFYFSVNPIAFFED